MPAVHQPVSDWGMKPGTQKVLLNIIDKMWIVLVHLRGIMSRGLPSRYAVVIYNAAFSKCFCFTLSLKLIWHHL